CVLAESTHARGRYRPFSSGPLVDPRREPLGRQGKRNASQSDRPGPEDGLGSSRSKSASYVPTPFRQERGDGPWTLTSASTWFATTLPWSRRPSTTRCGATTCPQISAKTSCRLRILGW